MKEYTDKLFSFLYQKFMFLSNTSPVIIIILHLLKVDGDGRGDGVLVGGDGGHDGGIGGGDVSEIF